MQLGGAGAAVRSDDADMDLVRACLGVNDFHVKIAVLIERTKPAL